MKVHYFMNSVQVTDSSVVIRRGLKKTHLLRDAIIGVETRPLTGKVIFITAKKRYKVVLWHGIRRIRHALGY